MLISERKRNLHHRDACIIHRRFLVRPTICQLAKLAHSASFTFCLQKTEDITYTDWTFYVTNEFTSTLLSVTIVGLSQKLDLHLNDTTTRSCSSQDLGDTSVLLFRCCVHLDVFYIDSR